MNFDFQKFKEGLTKGIISKETTRPPAELKLEHYQHQLNHWEQEITLHKKDSPKYTRAEKQIKKYKALLHIK